MLLLIWHGFQHNASSELKKKKLELMDRQLKAMYHTNYIFERFYDLEVTKQKAFTTGFEEGGLRRRLVKSLH